MNRTFGRLGDGSDPVGEKLAAWLTVTATSTPADVRELMRFTLENSGWPKLYVFRDRIEKGLSSATTFRPHETAEWFDQTPPKTAAGLTAYLTALQRLEQDDKAKAALRRFWRDGDLNKKETAELAARYRKLLAPADHADRLDNLLWSRRYAEAEAMLPLVDAEQKKLAEARIALGRLSSAASRLVQAVPAGLQGDSGLLFDRLRWRRQKNKDEDAFALLQQLPKPLPRAERWWQERNILARRAIEKNKYARAYEIISGHGLTSGADYAQAEWTMGWLALSFLNQPDKAYRHFDRFYQAVGTAVSRSRAAWWLAHAAAKLKQRENAKNWYTLGTQFPSTFYGQLCAEKIGAPIRPEQFLDDQVAPEIAREFEQKELVRAIRLLARNDLNKYAETFFLKLLLNARTRPDYVLIARLARETDSPRFAVEANKQLQQKLGEFMFAEGYPLLPSLSAKNPESALIHAIVQRESMFDTGAVSPAGARGLMQLMPATAKHVSRNIGQHFSLAKLHENPHYNIELGAAYLQRLLDSYDGFYPLAIAAYNAGPSNVALWLKEFGDPRHGKVSVIDWIEQIPIYETRNYVQRVMESYYIYKLRLNEDPRTVLAFKNE